MGGGEKKGTSSLSDHNETAAPALALPQVPEDLSTSNHPSCRRGKGNHSIFTNYSNLMGRNFKAPSERATEMETEIYFYTVPSLRATKDVTAGISNNNVLLYHSFQDAAECHFQLPQA
ncbi:hypothetical protein RRG08_063724 [Elysia crispata]|uniref:Uncharacterized protein n=1 Tax=Elysia crispata TaxID=231223 RepID=A0AAE0ZWA1_9GAST|nr:hypothetical protein RRG08_063724 [Elysia crispata]